ncbi:MAG: OmpA family protein [Leptothrix sp. (in: Bacteria)]|nr:OmpA family protein [Leptothrix sp. (in: b-proteobacteria)]
MNRAAWALGTAATLSCVAGLTACGVYGSPSPAPQAADRGSSPTIHRIAQLDFGRNARYASCLEPACPRATTKTLAALRAPVAKEPLRAADLPASAASTAAALPTTSIAQPPPAPPPAPHTLILHFATQSAVLTQAHKALLRDSLDDLQRTDRILIAGRTDDLGSESLNQSLAFARALAIRDHLLDLAPDLPARIAIDAKGRCCYAASNQTAVGRAQNRRVEISFTPRAEGTP